MKDFARCTRWWPFQMGVVQECTVACAAGLLGFGGLRKVAGAFSAWWLSLSAEQHLMQLVLGACEVLLAVVSAAFHRLGQRILGLLYTAYATVARVWWFRGHGTCGCLGGGLAPSAGIAILDATIATSLFLSMAWGRPKPVACGPVARLCAAAVVTSALWTLGTLAGSSPSAVHVLDATRLLGRALPIRLHGQAQVPILHGKGLLVLADPACARCTNIVGLLARGGDLYDRVHCWPASWSDMCQQPFSVAVVWLGPPPRAVATPDRTRNWLVFFTQHPSDIALRDPPILLWIRDGEVVAVCCPSPQRRCWIRKRSGEMLEVRRLWSMEAECWLLG